MVKATLGLLVGLILAGCEEDDCIRSHQECCTYALMPMVTSNGAVGTYLMAMPKTVCDERRVKEEAK